MTRGELSGDLVILLEKLALRRDSDIDIASDGLGRVQLRFLRQIANREPIGGKRLAVKFGHLTRHDPEERALSGPIQSQHTDLGAWQE